MNPESSWNKPSSAANFLDELIWMATVLRWGRENVPNE
jgi:hypothetical protein